MINHLWCPVFSNHHTYTLCKLYIHVILIKKKTTFERGVNVISYETQYLVFLCAIKIFFIIHNLSIYNYRYRNIFERNCGLHVSACSRSVISLWRERSLVSIWRALSKVSHLEPMIVTGCYNSNTSHCLHCLKIKLYSY